MTAHREYHAGVATVAAPSVTLRLLRRDEIRPLAAALADVSAEQLENRWREQELGYRELFVAEQTGDLVGTVSLGETAGRLRSLHLFALEVAAALRGRGIGGEIVRLVVEEAQRRRCSRVHLEVRIDNPARRLYHRLGFRRVGGSFINAWWLFGPDGARERVEEQAVRMIKRV